MADEEEKRGIMIYPTCLAPKLHDYLQSGVRDCIMHANARNTRIILSPGAID